MAGILDLPALIDDALVAVDNDDTAALKKIIIKANMIIGAAPETTTDQTFTSWRNATASWKAALDEMKTLNGGSYQELPVEFH